MKNKINFYTTIKGVDNIYPIIPIKKYIPEWLKKSKSTFNKHSHVLKCPGIKDSLKYGWLIRLWQDIKLDIDENGKYNWSSPSDMAKLSNNLNESQFAFHDENAFYNHTEKWPKDSFTKIVKINIPYVVEVPKGYLLYQVHPFYLDENRFTSLPGAYNPAYGMARLQVPMIAHISKGSLLLEAGTIVAQLFLVKEEEFEYEILHLEDDKDALKFFKTSLLSLRNKFIRNYSKIKEIFNKNDI
jgi:hypothetical protein